MSQEAPSHVHTRARPDQKPGEDVRPDRSYGEREDGWLRDSAISGFFATFALSVTLVAGYGAARAVGEETGNLLQRWVWNLTDNTVVQATEDRATVAVTINIAAGLILAMIYGRFAEPLLPGGPVRKGMLFALIPFVLSLLVFFPAMDSGFLGLDIDAGPLPIIGNLAVHLVYGAVLGWMYGIPLESGIDDNPLDRAANVGAERGAAKGVPVGAVIGAISAFIISPTLDDITNQFLVVMIGALTGGAVGLLIGSLFGLGGLGDEEQWTEA